MVKKVYILMVILSFTFIFLSPVMAGGGIRVATSSARAMAMGSNYRAISNDWSAVYYNPAGITQMIGDWHFGASSGIVMPRTELKAYDYDVMPFSGLHTSTTKMTEKNTFTPSGALFYRLSEKLFVGLGMFTPFALDSEWDLITLPQNYGNTLTNKDDTYSRYRVYCFQPTFAYKVDPNLSIGFGMSFIYGEVTEDKVNLPVNPAVQYWRILQERADLLGLALPDLSADQNRIAYEKNIDMTGTGVGFNFGLHVRFTDEFSMGLSGRYYMNLDLEGDYKETKVPHYNEIIYSTLNQMPAEFYDFENGVAEEVNKTEMVGAFNGENEITGESNNARSSMPLPFTAGLGFAYQAHPRFLFSGDVEWTNWSDWRDLNVSADGEIVDNALLDWKNTIQAGLGFEWTILHRGTSKLQLRGGWHAVDSPSPDENIIPTILDPIRRNIFTAGFGLKFGNLHINMAYEFSGYKDKDLEKWKYEENFMYARNWAGVYNHQVRTLAFDAHFAF